MISPKVMVELHQAKLVPTQFTVTKPGEHAWSAAEQRRFWDAIHRFPQGPWTAIAAYVGSKSTRQAMTHAQKLRQKLNRWKRRVRNDAASNAGDCSPRSVAHDDMDDMDDGEYDDNDGDDSESVCSVKFERMDANSAHEQQLRSHVPVKSPLDVASLSPNDVACSDDTDDAYLEHLLSDIEPMLETVVNFTSAAPASSSSRSAGSGECAPLLYCNSYDAAVFASAYPIASDASSSSSFADIAHQYASQSFVLSDASYATSHQQHQQYVAPSDVYMAPIDFRL